MNGFVNLLKPPCQSSHDAVSEVRRILHVRRVGHAGTLDPGAAGVLPIAVGRATRLLEYLADDRKAYRALMRLGLETDSGDDLGATVATVDDVAMPSGERLLAAATAFTGTITQTPPVFSAIKIGGRRACDLARQHLDVAVPARTVVIHRLTLAAQPDGALLLDVECGKGTYIRTLCQDLGRWLGTLGTMAFLVRTRVGAFTLAESVTLEELRELGEAALLPPETMLTALPRCDLAPERARAFLRGLPSRVVGAGLAGETMRVFGNGIFLGVGRCNDDELRPVKVYEVE